MDRLRLLLHPRLASLWWYAVAMAIFVLGWIVAVAWQASAWNELRDATVSPFGTPVQASGTSVAVLTDLQQPQRQIVCTAVGPGRQRTVVPAAPLAYDVTSGGTTWHLIGLLDNGRDNMRLRCTPRDRGTDTASYGSAVLHTVGQRSGTPIALGAGIIALLLAGVTTAARLSSWRGAPQTSRT